MAGINPLPLRETRPESLINQAPFRPYCVTRARLFLMRSAALSLALKYNQMDYARTGTAYYGGAC